MKWIARLVLLSATPLLMASMWMDRQPSPKPYQAPVLAPPPGSVPVTGREILSWESEPKKPHPSTAASVAQGAKLFAINCAMCHGTSPAEPGAVGKKLVPPPPGLDHDLMRNRSDAHIYKAISLGIGRMPPFLDKLTQQERWDLVDHLRARQ